MATIEWLYQQEVVSEEQVDEVEEVKA